MTKKKTTTTTTKNTARLEHWSLLNDLTINSFQLKIMHAIKAYLHIINDTNAEPYL